MIARGMPLPGLVVWAWLCASFLAPACPAASLHQDLTVTLEPSLAALQVRGEVSVSPGPAQTLRLDGRFTFDELVVDGRAVAPQRVGPDGAWRWVVPASSHAARVVRIAYHGTLPRLDDGLDHRQVLALSGAVAGTQGAYLGAGTGWHPQAGDLVTSYRVRLSLPARDRGLVPGRLVEEQVRGERYLAEFEQREPLAGIDLFAGPYTVREIQVALAPDRSVLVRTYFHADVADLAAGYLDAAARYLVRYDTAIGAYPFAAYSVVSSPLPTGLGMPAVAYLGRQVIRLPFIRATSLGHEVLHNWWGNGVVPDHARGNWSEGLTTFMADYAYREDDGAQAARDMRLGWLRDFAAVRAELDQPLARFVSRRHGAGQAVGYNKAAFVFHMLRDLVGVPAFTAALRDFYARHRLQTAGWAELRAAFERASGRELGVFFTQWVDRAGAPALAVTRARRAGGQAGERIEVILEQSGAAIYDLQVPLRMHLQNGQAIDATVRLVDATGSFALDAGAPVRSVALDPDLRVFRRLAPEEVAPILRQVLIDPCAATYLADTHPDARAAAQALAEAALDHGVRTQGDARPRPGTPLLVAGTYAAVDDALARAGLPDVPAELRGRGTGFAYAWQTGGETYAVAAARDQQALRDMARALPHLGAQSHAVFDGPRSSARGVWRREPKRVEIEREDRR